MSCFFNDTATTEIYTLSLHDALPICPDLRVLARQEVERVVGRAVVDDDRLEVAESLPPEGVQARPQEVGAVDRKSTRLNSSHANISYAVFCLKKKHTQLSS